jgi:hypothetical protein
MKKIILLISLFVFTNTIRIYSQDTTKTLFHFHVPKINYLGLYVAPEYQYGQLKNGFTSFGGFSGMILFNKKFAAGVTIQKSLDHSYSPSGISPLKLSGQFAGIEYTIHPDKAVHFSFPLIVGMGSCRIDSASYTKLSQIDTTFQDRRNNKMEHKGNRSDYFLIQPGVQVEANLFKFIKLYFGASYRFSINTEGTISSTISATALQGFSLNAGMKIGFFDYNTRRKK